LVDIFVPKPDKNVSAPYIVIEESYTMSPYRSKTEITNIMLETVKTGSKKTNIMYRANLSYTQLTGYLYYLEQNGLIKHEPSTQTYKSTEKGLKFLNLSNKLSKMTSA
jgi:predicted transcriptional regulator